MRNKFSAPDYGKHGRTYLRAKSRNTAGSLTTQYYENVSQRSEVKVLMFCQRNQDPDTPGEEESIESEVYPCWIRIWVKKV